MLYERNSRITIILTLEALVIAFIVGTSKNSLFLGIVSFVAVGILYMIPVIGQTIGIFNSLLESAAIFGIITELKWFNNTEAAFSSVVIFLVLIYLHNTTVEAYDLRLFGFGWLLFEVILAAAFIYYLKESIYLSLGAFLAAILLAVTPFVRVVEFCGLSFWAGYFGYAVLIPFIEKKYAVLCGAIVFLYSVAMYIYVYEGLDYIGSKRLRMSRGKNNVFFKRKIGPVFVKEGVGAKEYADKLEVLCNSAKGALKEEIGKKLKFIKAGIKGEQEIAYELKNCEIDMYIIHDLWVKTNRGLSSQIDYMVITRKSIYIIECKNFRGNIEITSSGDFIRDYNNEGKRKEERIYSPTSQNDKHLNTVKQLCLESKRNFWAKYIFEKKFNNLYRPLVVLANSATILNARYAKEEVKEKVIHADQLVEKIKEIDSKQEKTMSKKEMLKIVDFFCSMDRPDNLFYNKKYQELEAKVNKQISSL